MHWSPAAICGATALALSACVVIINDHDTVKAVPSRHETINEDVRISQGRRAASIETVNGLVELEDHAHARSILTINGSIKLGRAVSIQSLESVNGRIQADDDLQVDGSIETVNGNIDLANGARIEETIGSVNGAIHLHAAYVGGWVEAVNSDFDTGSSSTIIGGIRYRTVRSDQSAARTPRVVIGPQSVISGPMVFERPVQLLVHESAQIASVAGADPIRFSGNAP